MSTRLEQARQHLNNQEYQQALTLAQGLVRMGQQLADANTILGLSANALGNAPLAKSALTKAANLAPQSPMAWNNLGKVAALQNDYPLMLSSFTKVVQLDASNVEAACQLALAHMHQGQPEKSLHILQGVLVTHPQHPKANAQLIALATDSQPLETWDALWQNIPVNQWPLEYVCQFALLKTLWSWGYAQTDFGTYLLQLRNLMEQAISRGLAQNPLVVNTVAYTNMFNHLAAHGPAPQPNPSLPPLYMLGDSHTIPPLGHTVTWRGRSHQLRARLLMGCKLWDIAKPGASLVRTMFAHHIHALPPGASIIISVGEIDARPLYGIYKRAKKHNLPWAPIIAATVPPAVQWLADSRQGRTLILQGIPAPLTPIKLGHAGEGNAADYTACTTAINEAMKTEAARHGLPFIDLFSYTTENPSSFAEDYHLLPTALPQALQTHLIPGG